MTRKKDFYGAEVVLFPRSRLSHKAAMENVVKPFMKYIEMYGAEKAKAFIVDLASIVEEIKEGPKQ